MQLTIASTNADLDSITFSEWRYGKCAGKGSVAYVLKVDADDFLLRFGKIYVDCIAELVRDDELTGEFHRPYAGATSYLPLEALLQLPDALRMEMIDTYFVFDILRMYVHEDVSSPAMRWVIDSVDSVSRQGATILIGGRAVPKVSGLRSSCDLSGIRFEGRKS